MTSLRPCTANYCSQLTLSSKDFLQDILPSLQRNTSFPVFVTTHNLVNTITGFLLSNYVYFYLNHSISCIIVSSLSLSQFYFGSGNGTNLVKWVLVIEPNKTTSESFRRKLTLKKNECHQLLEIINMSFTHLQKSHRWDFLTVQWLRLCASNTGAQVQSLVRALRSHMPCGQKNFFLSFKKMIIGGKNKEITQICIVTFFSNSLS